MEPLTRGKKFFIIHEIWDGLRPVRLLTYLPTYLPTYLGRKKCFNGWIKSVLQVCNCQFLMKHFLQSKTAASISSLYLLNGKKCLFDALLMSRYLWWMIRVKHFWLYCTYLPTYLPSYQRDRIFKFELWLACCIRIRLNTDNELLNRFAATYSYDILFTYLFGEWNCQNFPHHKGYYFVTLIITK